MKTDGGVRCWGSNFYGQLGDGTPVNREYPVDVSGLSGPAVSVKAGGVHSCALTFTGSVLCWGGNGRGQLGDDTRLDSGTPRNVVLPEPAAAIAAGTFHSCALLTSGAVNCWGANDSGQVGDGSTVDRNGPVAVQNLGGPAMGIAAGGGHTCALTTGGGVRCWGSNAAGQLGDGTTVGRPLPATVSGLGAGATMIATGIGHVCAVLSTGAARCWGWNNQGQLGDGTTVNRATPVNVLGPGNWAAVSGGEQHSCGVTVNGAARCWGDNNFQALGDGTSEDRSSPVDVLGLSSGVHDIAAGTTQSCALTAADGVRCWGYGLGEPAFSEGPRPVDAAGLSGRAVDVRSGRLHTCVLSSGGGLRCWGSNFYGQIGDGTTQTPRTRATPVISMAGGVSAFAPGGFHTCSVFSNGRLYCWGYKGNGEVGSGNTADRSIPYWINLGDGNPGTPAADVAAGYSHTCAVTSGGGVKCWGANWAGQLGTGNVQPQLRPHDVLGMMGGVAKIVAGAYHTCALTTGGGVKCWGLNDYGSLGNGSTEPSYSAVQVSGLTSGVVDIAAGLLHTCAITAEGGMKCWGNNLDGQLGDGTAVQRESPTAVLGLSSGVSAIATGYYHSCAATSAGMTCWGYNGYGQLGDGSTASRATPGAVSGIGGDITKASAGLGNTCAVSSEGALACWGYNMFGSVGDGTTINRARPTVIVRKRQSIAAALPSSLVIGVPMPLAATSSSGLPVTIDTWTPSICSVSGNSVTATSSGVCGIRASQHGDGSTAPASQHLRLAAAAPGPPVVVAPTKASISMAKATLGATVSLDGGSPILDRGVVVSVTSVNANPLIGGSGVTQFPTSGTTGLFTLFATGLNPSTAYSFKAYAINALGTSYTAVSTFTTPAPPSRVFVSSSGSDANVCSDQLAPCRSISEGIAQVLADGEVIILKPGEYETTPLIITKGVKVTSPSGTVAFVRQPITINAPGGRVALRGLTLKGNGAGDGITLVAASSLSVEETTFDRWATGLRLVAGSGSFVSVTNSVFAVNTVGVQLASGATNGVSIEGTRFEGNGTGLSISGGSFFVRESSFIGNATAGATIDSGTADIQRSEFTLNGVGVNALSGGTARLSRSVAFGNTTGLFAAGGSTFESSGTNVIRGNGTDTSGTITVVPEQ